MIFWLNVLNGALPCSKWNVISLNQCRFCQFLCQNKIKLPCTCTCCGLMREQWIMGVISISQPAINLWHIQRLQRITSYKDIFWTFILISFFFCLFLETAINRESTNNKLLFSIFSGFHIITLAIYFFYLKKIYIFVLLTSC